jgi:hypothetical protein
MLLLRQGGLATRRAVRDGLRGGGRLSGAARPPRARAPAVATFASGRGGEEKSWAEVASDVAGVAK